MCSLLIPDGNCAISCREEFDFHVIQLVAEPFEAGFSMLRTGNEYDCQLEGYFRWGKVPAGGYFLPTNPTWSGNIFHLGQHIRLSLL